jgi:hypothetical protein
VEYVVKAGDTRLNKGGLALLPPLACSGVQQGVSDFQNTVVSLAQSF